MTFTKQLLAIGMLICITCATAFGQTTLYWTGNTDTTWNNAGNWSATPGGSSASVPTSADIAIFADSAVNHCVLDVNASVAELLISATSNKNLDLNGYNLTVAGDFTQNTAIFQGGNGAITIGGLLHIIGGEFHATTGTTSVADGIVEEGYYFSPHGGKVSITGTGASIDMTSFFYDLEIATSASAELANSIQVANNLDLDGPLDADVNVIVLGNDAPGAITGTNGVYFNIGAGPIGLFIWLIGENTGTYTLPFLATTSGPVIPVEVDITTAGDGPDGAMLFSCIELDYTKPQELLGDGIGYYNATGGNNADYNANRIWVMIASDYTESPEFDLELSYTTADLSGISVTEANLKMQAYDELHWGELLGTVNTTANTLAVTGYTLPTDDRTSFITLVDNTSPNKSTYGGKTGLTCADAVELDSIDIETVFEMLDTNMWFKFTATDTAMSYFFYELELEQKLLDASISLYEAPCSSNVLLKIDTLPRNYYRMLSYNNYNVTETYLLKVSSLVAVQGGFVISKEFVARYPIECSYKMGEFDNYGCDTSTNCSAFDVYNHILLEEDRFLPPHFPEITMGVNILVLQKKDGSDNFQGTPNQLYYLENMFNENFFGSVSYRYKNLSDMFHPNSPSHCYDGYLSDTRIRFELNEIIYYRDSTPNNFYHSIYQNRFFDVPVAQLADSFNTLGNKRTITIILPVDTVRLDSLKQGHVLSTSFGLAFGFYPYYNYTDSFTFGPDVYPNSLYVKMPSMYTNYLNDSIKASRDPDDYFDTIHPFLENALKRSSSGQCFGLVHEFGHCLLGAMKYGNSDCPSTGCLSECTFDGFSYGGHRNDCRDHVMHNRGSGGTRSYLKLADIALLYKNLSVKNVKFTVANCPYSPFNDFEVTGNDTINFDFTWYGDIVVKSGGTLLITCTVRMPDNAKIIVERGGKLIVDGGRITSACDGLWAGIEVWGTSTLSQPNWADCDDIETNTNSNFGAVCIKNGAIIENAGNGVAAVRFVSNGSGGTYHDLAYNGGIIHAENSTFRNNRNSVLFSQYNKIETQLVGGTLSFRQKRQNNSAFVGCTFETVKDYEGPFYSFVGMWDVHGVTFEDNTFINNEGIRGIGIISYSSEYSVECETDDPGYYEPCKSGGHTNHFTGLDYGIIELSSKNFSLGGLVVKGAEFDGVGNSITFSGSFLPTANLNDINIGTSPALPSYAPTAIYYNSVIGGRMFENSINTNYVSGNSPYGVVVNATSIFEQDIYRNTFEGDIGGSAMNAQNNNDYVVFKCNQVLDNMTNLAIYNKSSVAELQGFCDFLEPVDNTLTSANWNVFQSRISPSRFEYHHSQDGSGAKYTPSNNYFEPGFFVAFDCGAQPANYCDTKFPGPTSPCGIYCLESSNTSINTSLASLSSQLDNNNTQGLYDLINDTGLADSIITDSLLSFNGTLSNNTILTMLYRSPQLDSTRMSAVLLNNYPHSSVVYREILEQFTDIPADSLAKLQQYQDSSSLRKVINDSIFTLSLSKMTNYVDILHLALPDSTVDMASIMDSLKLETDPALRLILASLYEMKGDFTLAKNIYDSIPLYSRELRDLIEYRQIAWNFTSQGWNWQELDSIGESSGFKDDLEDLAIGDSTAGAMYARNVLSLLNDSIHPFIYLFAEDTSSSKRGYDELLPLQNVTNETEAVKILKVFPNPVENKLTVEYELIDGQREPVKFVVYNSMGQMVMERTLMPDATKVTFNMSEFNNGFYFYTLKCSACKDQDGKFIILR